MDTKQPFILLDQIDSLDLWGRIYSELDFHPNVKESPLTINQRNYAYDISELTEENIQMLDEYLPEIFARCLGLNEYMIAMDTQKNEFLYNPRIKLEKKIMLVNDSQNGAHNVYFPDFYPDSGDYCFFVDKDLKWGYVGHPWLQKIWVFGSSLLYEIDKIKNDIGFTKYKKKRMTLWDLLR